MENELRILSTIVETVEFKSVDELKKVSGIGAKTIEKLKDYVTVD